MKTQLHQTKIDLREKIRREMIGLLNQHLAVELGGVALGTVQVVGKRSKLVPYPLDIASGKPHVAALAGALATFGASARAAIETAGNACNADTGDLFTGVSRGVDKLFWLVEAHAQAKE